MKKVIITICVLLVLLNAPAAISSLILCIPFWKAYITTLIGSLLIVYLFGLIEYFKIVNKTR